MTISIVIGKYSFLNILLNLEKISNKSSQIILMQSQLLNKKYLIVDSKSSIFLI